MSEKRYPIVIERTTTGFSAYSPDVPGLRVHGRHRGRNASKFSRRSGGSLWSDARDRRSYSRTQLLRRLRRSGRL